MPNQHVNAAEQDPRFAEGCPPETAAVLREERRKRWASLDLKRMIAACGFSEVRWGDAELGLKRMHEDAMFAVDAASFTRLMEAASGAEGFKVVDAKRCASEDQVIAAFKRRRLRPVTLTEVLVYGAKLERKFRDHSEIVFGWPIGVATCRYGREYEIVPLIHACGGRRWLDFSASRVGWRRGMAGHRLGITKDG